MPESKARRGGIVRPYCDESQRGYRVRAACIAAKYSRVTGTTMDWGEEDIDRAHDVFEKYGDRLEAGEPVDWREFELELEKVFNPTMVKRDTRMAH